MAVGIHPVPRPLRDRLCSSSAHKWFRGSVRANRVAPRMCWVSSPAACVQLGTRSKNYRSQMCRDAWPLICCTRRRARQHSQTAGFIQLPANHDIASEIGTVRELVSRHLSQLNKKGIIRLTGRKFCVLDVDALAREAAGIHRRKLSHRPLAIAQVGGNTPCPTGMKLTRVRNTDTS